SLPIHIVQPTINPSSPSQSSNSTHSDLSIAPATTPTPTSISEVPSPSSSSSSSSSKSASITEELAPSPELPSPSSSSKSPSPIRKSTRTRKAPQYLQDYHCTAFPLNKSLSYHRLSTTFAAFSASISSQVDPQTYNQAVKDSGWCEAMQAELDALKLNHTWTMVDLPPGKEPIEC
ncbi:hypothetical protein F2P56_031310, partial [Juglans regia]